MPCRAAVYAGGKRASAVNARQTGRELSRQSLGILDRIREVDGLMTPGLQARVREGHPEVTFAVLNGRPLAHGKKTPEGEQERLCILRKMGVFDPAEVRRELEASCVGRDDIIDAAACLATASRIMPGAAQPLAPRDAKGLRMEIVA